VRLPRMTTRRMMLAVLLVASLLGGTRLWVLSRHYLELARDHETRRREILRSPDDVVYWEARWTDQREGFGAAYPWPAGPPFVPAITAYHAAMRDKWGRAASRPWLPVEPDPSLNRPAP
jgi:hypothetical protein